MGVSHARGTPVLVSAFRWLGVTDGAFRYTGVKVGIVQEKSFNLKHSGNEVYLHKHFTVMNKDHAA